MRPCSPWPTPARASPTTCATGSSTCSCRASAAPTAGRAASASVSRWCGGSSSSTRGRWRSRATGRGRAFTVRLPRALAPMEAPAARPPIGGQGLRILLVEDNADAREMLSAALRLQGHEVHVATDGPEAVSAAFALEPDAALVDIGLPGFDGYEVARRIRAGRNGRTTRLVALTGYGQPEDRRRTRDAGFDEHLVKPVDRGREAEALKPSA